MWSPRVLGTEWVDALRAEPSPAAERAEELRAQVIEAITTGTPHELVPFTGQTAGLIRETLPAGEIVSRMVAEAEAAIARLTAAT